MHKIKIKSIRVKPSEKDSSLFYYDIRHSDSDWDKPISLERQVIINFWGMIISTESFDKLLKEKHYYDFTSAQRSVLYDNVDSGKYIDGSLLFPDSQRKYYETKRK